MIYLDNNATTQIHPDVLEAMLPFLRDQYFNPSSGYRAAKPIRAALDKAREQLASLINAEPDEIIFTSCGTESNNTSLAAIASIFPDRRHFITCETEHSAILLYTKQLEERGYEITKLATGNDGRIDLSELEAAIRPNETAGISLMWANNESGVLGPIHEAADIAKKQGVGFHTDAVNTLGKIPIDVRASPIHFLSMSGHKIHAPKGVGALYVNKNVRFRPMLHGGSQEGKRRGGTENVASIVGLGHAAEMAQQRLKNGGIEALREKRDLFENTVCAAVDGIERNGSKEHCLANTANLYIPGIEAQAALILLDEKGVCVSTGSACSTGNVNPSHVLTAMGCNRERAFSSLRFSVSSMTTLEEVKEGAAITIEVLKKLRALKPKSSGNVIRVS